MFCFSAITDTEPIVISLDESLKMQWFSRKSAPSSIAELEDFIGQRCFNIFNDKESPCPDCPVVECLRTGRTVDCLVDGDDERTYSINAHPVLSDSRTAGAIVVSRDVTSSKRIERFQSEPVSLYKTLFEKSALAEMIFDSGTLAVFGFNDEAGCLTGYSRDALFDLRLGDFLQGPAKIDPDEFIESLRKNRSAERETVFTTPDGRDKYFHINFSMVNHLGRELVYCIFYDVSDRRLVDEVLVKSENQYRSLVENSPDIITEIDLQGNIIYTNRILTGAGLGSESFTNFLEFIPKESHSMVRRALHKSLVRKKNTHFELEIETKTGPRWWSIRVLPLIDNGNVRSFLLVSTDITFRRDAEEALKKSEERYRFLAENMLDSVFMMDLNWNHIYVSPSIEKIRGYTPDEIMTLPIEESLPSHSLERAFQLRDHEANRLKNDPKAVPIVYTFEQEENCKDGSTVWTEVRAWCVIDENREPAYIMGITHDITERREAEARLRQSEENYRTLMENLPLPAIVHRDARLVFVNSRAVMELGVHDPDEVLGRSLYDFLHPDYHDMVRERIQEMQQAPAAHISRLNLKIIKIDGSVIEVRTSASRILYEGEPAHLVLVEEVLGS